MAFNAEKFLEVNNQSSVSTPGAGMVRVYSKSDKMLYMQDEDGLETLLVGASGAAGTYARSFVDGDLDASGFLTVSHNLGSTYPHVVVYDESKEMITPDAFYVDVNTIKLGLDYFTPLSGTWNTRVSAGAGEGSGGATDFTDLADTPSTYTGMAASGVRVSSLENGLEFFDISSVGPGGGGLEWSIIDANTTADAGKGYLINASAGNVTLTLPATPSEGDEVGVCDYTHSATSNNITVARNGNKIIGEEEDLEVDIDAAGFSLVYGNAARGWEIVTEISGGGGSSIRTLSITTTDSFTPDLDYNTFYITALAEDVTIQPPSGSPSLGEVFVIYIKDDGTTRDLTFDATYLDMGLIAATTASKWSEIIASYNGSDWLTSATVEE
jgi:hypothetical protein